MNQPSNFVIVFVKHVTILSELSAARRRRQGPRSQAAISGGALTVTLGCADRGRAVPVARRPAPIARRPSPWQPPNNFRTVFIPYLFTIKCVEHAKLFFPFVLIEILN